MCHMAASFQDLEDWKIINNIDWISLIQIARYSYWSSILYPCEFRSQCWFHQDLLLPESVVQQTLPPHKWPRCQLGSSAGQWRRHHNQWRKPSQGFPLTRRPVRENHSKQQKNMTTLHRWQKIWDNFPQGLVYHQHLAIVSLSVRQGKLGVEHILITMALLIANRPVHVHDEPVNKYMIIITMILIIWILMHFHNYKQANVPSAFGANHIKSSSCSIHTELLGMTWENAQSYSWMFHFS